MFQVARAVLSRELFRMHILRTFIFRPEQWKASVSWLVRMESHPVIVVFKFVTKAMEAVL